MSRFETPLKLLCHRGVKLKDAPFEVLEEFVYCTDVLPGLRIIRVPVGYRSDFASIPRFMWRVIPPSGKYREAAVVHDYLCDVEPKLCGHIQAAEVFNEAMKDLNVKSWRRKLMVSAVKRFGPKFKAETDPSD